MFRNVSASENTFLHTGSAEELPLTSTPIKEISVAEPKQGQESGPDWGDLVSIIENRCCQQALLTKAPAVSKVNFRWHAWF